MLTSSKSRLTPLQAERFPKDTLFHKIARAVCRAGVLPAKELFESWEMARRVRRKFRGGRIVDLACGHGLLAHILLLLDDTSPEAVAVDTRIPSSARRLATVLVEAWPRLGGRVRFVAGAIETFDLLPEDIVVSAHACGALTDRVMQRAVAAKARLAVLPCCQDVVRSETGALEGWIDGPLAVDVMRAVYLRQRGYTVITRIIPPEITPKNRLLMGEPKASL
jgi:SAM-dependent methyltransferase